MTTPEPDAATDAADDARAILEDYAATSLALTRSPTWLEVAELTTTLRYAQVVATLAVHDQLDRIGTLLERFVDDKTPPAPLERGVTR